MVKKRGRPPKEPDEAKSRYLQVRVNPDEKAEYEAAAALAGVPVSEWVRGRLQRAATRALQGKKSGPKYVESGQ